MLLTAHTFACLWWFYQKQQNSSLMEPGYDFTVLPGQIPTWAQLEGEDVLQHSYSLCLAFVLMLFAGNTNQSMKASSDKVIASLMMLIGSLVLAIMISQMGVLMATMQAAHREYNEKLNSVNVMMKKLKLPPMLRSRIEQYYHYMWHTHGSFDVLSKLNAELSKSLVNEMSIFFHRRMLAKVPMFAEFSLEVTFAVVKRLVAELYLEGDFILRAGMPTSAMYFISYGRCSVLLDDPNKFNVLYRVRTLRRHSYFGELSLVNEKQPATAHILAENNVGVFALHRRDFEDIKHDHPELLAEILKAVGRAHYAHESKQQNQRSLRAFCSVRMQLSVHTELTPFMVQEVVDTCEQAGFQDKERIISMREQASGLYFLLEGSAVVCVPSLSGGNSMETVRVLNPGEFFGDISLVNGQLVSANVIAMGSCLCQVLYKDQYNLLKFRHPEFEGLLRAAMLKRNYQQLPPFLNPPSLLLGISGALARALVEKLKFESIPSQGNVLVEGEPHDGMFIVARGEIEVEVRMIQTLLGTRIRSLELFEPPERNEESDSVNSSHRSSFSAVSLQNPTGTSPPPSPPSSEGASANGGPTTMGDSDAPSSVAEIATSKGCKDRTMSDHTGTSYLPPKSSILSPARSRKESVCHSGRSSSSRRSSVDLEGFEQELSNFDELDSGSVSKLAGSPASPKTPTRQRGRSRSGSVLAAGRRSSSQLEGDTAAPTVPKVKSS